MGFSFLRMPLTCVQNFTVYCTMARQGPKFHTCSPYGCLSVCMSVTVPSLLQMPGHQNSFQRHFVSSVWVGGNIDFVLLGTWVQGVYLRLWHRIYLLRIRSKWTQMSADWLLRFSVSFSTRTHPSRLRFVDVFLRPFTQMAKLMLLSIPSTSFPVHCSLSSNYSILCSLSDRLCGLVVRVLDYRCRGPGFDSQALQKKNKKKISGSGTGCTQPREYNWGATW
jgi:hypothetical protein